MLTILVNTGEHVVLIRHQTYDSAKLQVLLEAQRMPSPETIFATRETREACGRWR